jgi:hypothetical protein
VARRSLPWVALVSLLLLSACGDGQATLDAEGYRERADAAFAAGDRLMEEAGGSAAAAVGSEAGSLHAEAIAAWVEAANDLIRAFRMEDPTPARRGVRALMAFRIGRSLSNAARYGVAHPHRDHFAQRALFWFGEAQALEPTLHAATFERAVLFDSEIGVVRDPSRAHAGYADFLAAVPAPGDGTQARLRARAQQRHDELDRLLRGLEADPPTDD